MDNELEYARSLLLALNTFRKDGVLCDIEIKVLGAVFHAHRVVLCAASSYFQAMFCSGMSETFQHVVKLHEFSPGIFEILLGFIYTGAITVTSTNIQDVLAAAKMLQLDKVVEHCCKFLISELSPGNAVGILMFAQQYSCRNLHNTVFNYIQRNFIEVSQSEEFLLMDKKTLLMFVESNDIRINQEEDVFDTVINWILFDVSTRCQSCIAREILKHVKLSFINPMHVENSLKRICSNASVAKDLKSLYQDLLKYQKQQKDNRFTCARTYTEKYFYIIGGCAQNPDARWPEVYSVANVERHLVNAGEHSPDNSKNSVIPTLCSMTYARNALGIAVLNGLIYAIGGEKDSLIYDSVECFNPVLNKWHTVAPMLSPRSGLGTCVINQEIFVVGGWIGLEIAKTIEKYNPDEDCWIVLGNVPTPRYNAGVCEMNGLIFIVGGADVNGEHLKSGDCYDPVREKWTEIAPMRHKRSSLCLVGLNGFIYSIGGFNDSEDGLNAVEKYDVERNVWHDVAPLPSARVSASATHYGRCIYVFGGRESNYLHAEILDNIDCFDTRNNNWVCFGKLQVRRTEAGVAIL